MKKLSAAQEGAMMKEAGTALRVLSERNQHLEGEVESLKDKVAQYQKKERAEKLATEMDAKGLQPELSYQEKVASIMDRGNLDAFEEALGMTPSQMKLASVHDDKTVQTEGGETSASGPAEAAFVSNILSI